MDAPRLVKFSVSLYIFVYYCIYIYIYTHTHTLGFDKIKVDINAKLNKRLTDRWIPMQEPGSQHGLVWSWLVPAIVTIQSYKLYHRNFIIFPKFLFIWFSKTGRWWTSIVYLSEWSTSQEVQAVRQFVMRWLTHVSMHITLWLKIIRWVPRLISNLLWNTSGWTYFSEKESDRQSMENSPVVPGITSHPSKIEHLAMHQLQIFTRPGESLCQRCCRNLPCKMMGNLMRFPHHNCYVKWRKLVSRPKIWRSCKTGLWMLLLERKKNFRQETG